MRNTFLIIYILTILVLSFMISCKKSVLRVAKNYLIGTWERTPTNARQTWTFDDEGLLNIINHGTDPTGHTRSYPDSIEFNIQHLTTSNNIVLAMNLPQEFLIIPDHVKNDSSLMKQWAKYSNAELL